MSGATVRSIPVMATIVTIEVVDAGPAPTPDTDPGAAIERAFEWFRDIERICSRFDDESELRRLTDRTGRPVPVSEILYAALEFALAVAEETRGAFDPTVGRRMETLGFDQNYLTGQSVRGDGPDAGVSYRDVTLDAVHKTVTLQRPLALDLGAVAKGLAIDLAARELAVFRDYAIDAGGDLYVAGHNADAEPWTVGIRHPRRDRQVIETVRVSDMAVCTSGDYERRGPIGRAGHHILDPRSGAPAGVIASATVIAPTAMLADALATAAFVLGPVEGIALLERHHVDGVLLSPALERFATRGMSSEILPNA